MTMTVSEFTVPAVEEIPYNPNYDTSRTSTFVKNQANVKIGSIVFIVEREVDPKGNKYRLLGKGPASEFPLITKITLDTKGRLLGIRISNSGPLKDLGCEMIGEGCSL